MSDEWPALVPINNESPPERVRAAQERLRRGHRAIHGPDADLDGPALLAGFVESVQAGFVPEPAVLHAVSEAFARVLEQCAPVVSKPMPPGARQRLPLISNDAQTGAALVEALGLNRPNKAPTQKDWHFFLEVDGLIALDPTIAKHNAVASVMASNNAAADNRSVEAMVKLYDRLATRFAGSIPDGRVWLGDQKTEHEAEAQRWFDSAALAEDSRLPDPRTDSEPVSVHECTPPEDIETSQYP